MNKILISSAVAVASVLGVVGVTGTVSAAPALAGTTTTQPPPCNVNGPVAGQGDDDFYPCVGPDGKAYPPKVAGSVQVQSVTTNCTSDIPKIKYLITYANGLPATTVTIIIKKGNEVLLTVPGKLFDGEITFPGVDLANHKFPGWDYDASTGKWTPDTVEQAKLAQLDIYFQIEDKSVGGGPTAQTKINFPALDPNGLACAPVQVKAPPTLNIGGLAPVCSGDVPHISYSVSGTDLDPAALATLTFFDLDGNQLPVTYPNVPLSGQVIYPGASYNPNANPTTDWPGWVYDPTTKKWNTDPTDARWRDGLTVRVDVGGVTAFGVVAYPAADTACNGPAAVGGPLPATGTDSGTPLKMAGLAGLTGVGLVLVARKRRTGRSTAAV